MSQQGIAFYFMG